MSKKANLFCYMVMLLVVWCGGNVRAGNGAPSVWYGPTNDHFKGDIVIRTIQIPYATTYTYYSTINWNAGADGGGYCGLQAHSGGGREYHFSIWDPSNGKSITAPYTAPGTEVRSFGGEGTGLKAQNYTLGWDTGKWYSLVVRCWDVGSNDTYFGYWVQDQSGNKWTHIVTMDFPMPGIRLNGGNGGFIEDWAGTGQNKRCYYIKGGSKRNLYGTWYGMSHCHIQANAAVGDPHDWNFNGGVTNGYYFVESGGDSTPSAAFNGGRSATFSNPQPDIPQKPTIVFSITSATANMVSWSVPVSSTPQFAYTIKINGTTVVSAKAPEARNVPLSAHAGDQVVVTLEDILGRKASHSTTLEPPDTTAPVPNPASWATEPWPVSDTAIAMQAVTASDPHGMEYYFTCTSGGGHDSGWQDEPSYTDTNLTPGSTYSYTVKTRDKSPNHNTTTPSPTKSATTRLHALLTDDLVVHYTLDTADINTNTTPHTVKDVSGNNKDGTIVADSGNPAGVIKQALRFNGSSDYVTIPPLNLNSNTVTISAWIKRNGSQKSYAGIVFSRAGESVAGLDFRHNNQLGYHWNDTSSTYGWASGLTVPDNQWCHVVLVVEPTKATIYLNDISSVNHTNHAIEEFNGITRIGRDRPGREFKGDIDDVAIWNRALSPAEVHSIYIAGQAGHSFQRDIPEVASCITLYTQITDAANVQTAQMKLYHDDIDPANPAQEGVDIWDYPWAKVSNNAAVWLKPYTQPWNVQLKKDVRPDSSTSAAEIYMAVVTANGIAWQFNNKQVYLHIDADKMANNFPGKAMIFQQVSLTGSTNELYPIIDIEAALKKNNGDIPLYDPQGNELILQGKYSNGQIYARGIIYFNVCAADIDKNGIVETNDLVLMQHDWLSTDAWLPGDISGPAGLPDKTVDMYDFNTLSQQWLK